MNKKYVTYHILVGYRIMYNRFFFSTPLSDERLLFKSWRTRTDV